MSLFDKILIIIIVKNKQYSFGHWKFVLQGNWLDLSIGAIKILVHPFFLFLALSVDFIGWCNAIHSQNHVSKRKSVHMQFIKASLVNAGVTLCLCVCVYENKVDSLTV